VTHGANAPNSPDPANLQRLSDTVRSAVKKTTGNPHPKLTIPTQLHHAE
jgi:hypothetical protein